LVERGARDGVKDANVITTNATTSLESGENFTVGASKDTSL